MGKTSSKVKQKYNEKTYRKLTFSIRKDSELCKKIEEFQEGNPLGFSTLMKTLLETHFKLKE